MRVKVKGRPVEYKGRLYRTDDEFDIDEVKDFRPKFMEALDFDPSESKSKSKSKAKSTEIDS